MEKVIWILTDRRKIVVAEQGQTWLLEKWSDQIPVLDGVTMQLDELMSRMAES